MNLKDLLDYRDFCPICNEKLESRTRYLETNLIINRDNVHISGSLTKRTMSFYNDGTFEKRNFPKAFYEPLKIDKYCKVCYPHDFGADGFTFPVGYITDNQYFIEYEVNTDNNTYTTAIVKECVQFSENDDIYQIECNFKEDCSKILFTSKFGKIKDAIYRKLPLIKLPAFKDKIKIKLDLLKTFS